MSAIGGDVSSGNLLDDLATRYASARRQDRKQLLSRFVDLLLELGRDADREPAPLERTILERIGNAPDFVLKGTLQQQVACKLATHLGLRDVNEIPRSVNECVVLPVIDALIEVLSLGAPTTRDAAVEGLGALLKLVHDPAVQFPSDKPLAVEREAGEKSKEDENYKRRAKISEQYFARLDRRRLMVLTIAGHPESRARFDRQLKEPIGDKLARLLKIEPVPWGSIEHELNEHSDLLRILPAMSRQGQNLPPNATVLLCAAAGVLAIGEDAPPENLVALARFQESVFRTIDAAVRRLHNWKWEDFDKVTAAAVRAIPQSIGGPPSVCNGQIRATVAILRTAIRLVIASGGSSSTKAAIEPLFRDIGRHMRWSNVGIVEGCYRGLPDLLKESRHNDLTAPALDTLFSQLKHPHKSDDPVEIHRHLIANACFRRMLISVAARGREGEPSDALRVEQQLRVLLRDPTPENVLLICQRDKEVTAWPAVVMPSDVAHTIIAGIAFESELLRRGASMFHGWDGLLTVEKVLLTRILGAQLHAISRDAPELKSHPTLGRIFSGISSISLTDAEAIDAAWKLLSSLPPGASESADAEIQRFVEYRGWGEGDLPGYVLARISPFASGRIAGAIAREIDLNLRRERRGEKHADLAKSLHQVMLRGPHESIFDHLLPRIRDKRDRDIVRLFRRHVANVLHAKKSGDVFDLVYIRSHVKSVLRDLQRQ